MSLIRKGRQPTFTWPFLRTFLSLYNSSFSSFSFSLKQWLVQHNKNIDQYQYQHTTYPHPEFENYSDFWELKFIELMAFRGFALCLVAVIVATMWSQNAAQSGCTNTLTSLSPCLNYIMGSSSTPSASCCSQLSSVVQSSPQCLCSVLNGGGSTFGITINQTLALSLPGACKVQTPPVSQCQGMNDKYY